MKRFFKTSAIAAMAIMTLNACSEIVEAPLADLNVAISMPDGFTAAYDGEFTLTNDEIGKTYTATASEGSVFFENILPGIYTLHTSKTMTKEEVAEAAPEAGITDKIILTGLRKNITVQALHVYEYEMELKWNIVDDLVISKIFCNGTKTNADGRENGPKYYEIFNNSSEVKYLDGLCLAAAHGLNTGKKDCELYLKYQDEATYAARICQLPGVHGKDQNIALEPGKSIVIAWNAVNNVTESMSMNADLSKADFEIDGSSHPRPAWTDNKEVPNLPYLHDCFPAGAGFFDMHQSLFIFYATPEDINTWENGFDHLSYMGAAAKWPGKRIPNNIIIDAVETFKTAAGQHKRIPDLLDASGVESNDLEAAIFIRKIEKIDNGRMILMDTNNSKNDFVAVGSKDLANHDGSHLLIRDYSHPEIQPAK